MSLSKSMANFMHYQKKNYDKSTEIADAAEEHHNLNTSENHNSTHNATRELSKRLYGRAKRTEVQVYDYDTKGQPATFGPEEPDSVRKQALRERDDELLR